MFLSLRPVSSKIAGDQLLSSPFFADYRRSKAVWNPSEVGGKYTKCHDWRICHYSQVLSINLMQPYMNRTKVSMDTITRTIYLQSFSKRIRGLPRQEALAVLAILLRRDLHPDGISQEPRHDLALENCLFYDSWNLLWRHSSV
jgi:hypothetical protein